MDNKFEIKDSGERREFETGAKRDVDSNKPRFDLIPTTVLKKICSKEVMEKFHLTKMFHTADSTYVKRTTKIQMLNLGFSYGQTANEDILLQLLWLCLDTIRQTEFDEALSMYDRSIDNVFHYISPKTYIRLANLYGGGAIKYDPWNWTKGMPFSVFYASLMRHIFKVIFEEIDEDHLSAIFFNAAAILHFRITGRNDLDDITPRLKEWEESTSGPQRILAKERNLC